MSSFFIGLQFLTRIKLVKQTEWIAEDFGKSVRFFPLIGACIGVLLALLAFFLYFILPEQGIVIPEHIRALLLLFAWICVTGALHCDGFMDTMDGIFSGRSRQRMLEIMKDSHVGAHGVTAFILLLMLKWSILLDLPQEQLCLALYTAPLIARMGMVIGITFFPYARPEGIGKAFAQYATRQACLIALILTLLLLLVAGLNAYIVAVTALGFAICFCRYVVKRLGGMTGDVYGAVTELTEAVVMGLFLL